MCFSYPSKCTIGIIVKMFYSYLHFIKSSLIILKTNHHSFWTKWILNIPENFDSKEKM